jgi:hypothetical protein
MKLKLLAFSFAFVIVQNCFAVLTAPNPVSPANNATGQVTNVLLDWSYVTSSGFLNPAINSFTINGIQNQKVTIINNLVEKVYTTTNFNALETIVVSGLAKGVYFVKVNERALKFMIA